MYIAGNRSFDTYEQAMTYCNLVDFDFYTMIEYKMEERSPAAWKMVY